MNTVSNVYVCVFYANVRVTLNVHIHEGRREKERMTSSEKEDEDRERERECEKKQLLWCCLVDYLEKMCEQHE